jgi:hypothetical protein
MKGLKYLGPDTAEDMMTQAIVMSVDEWLREEERHGGHLNGRSKGGPPYRCGRRARRGLRGRLGEHGFRAVYLGFILCSSNDISQTY